ncbi:hypothetical protein GCM10017044_28430 [Kordiimonas sediminis]|uniref:NAD(P)/FAD-dependent oxidoreductase n=1 Tax=Kordiimonas sediminis TaxID=1735581 RepID=A0A919EAV4_9PROT|nr:NAD(P)/FAD-dependent oxidoreductase [Kordiimonas sediminis]GHF31260.1 hypothetical protein GCM10017044_28430 [Kordiimonas sediminis]
MTKKYDVIIIGGGNAGFGVSAVASEAGKTIAFIEREDFGGTCPNRGCTPKKVLVAAAHTLHEIDLAHHHAIEVSKPVLDWKKLIQREKAMIDFIPDAMAGVAEKRGDVYRGSGRFVGRNQVEVNDEVLEGEHIVIATGSRPRPLPIPGADLMLTSDDLLSDETLPKDMVFVGGGVIAMEFSHIFARAGVKVTILEVMPRLLPQLDEGAVDALLEESKRLGITVYTGVQISEITETKGRRQVVFTVDGYEKMVDCDSVVNGAGRIANVEGLDLDAAGVEFDGVAISVDKSMRSTTNPAIWVCGDALVGTPQLSPVATYEGRLVGENIVAGISQEADYRVLPSAVYTVPALASVGLTEAAATEKGLNVSVTINDMTGWFSGKSYAETVAYAKVIRDVNTDQILGAHLVGHRAEELIHMFAFAMRYEVPASSLKNDFYAFPTFASDVKNLF